MESIALCFNGFASIEVLVKLKNAASVYLLNFVPVPR